MYFTLCNHNQNKHTTVGGHCVCTRRRYIDVHVYMYMYLCTHMYRSEVNVSCLLQSLSTLFFGDRISYQTWRSSIQLEKLTHDPDPPQSWRL